MRTPFNGAAGLVMVMCLASCDKLSKDPPVPITEGAPPTPSVAAPDTSVPSAESVFATPAVTAPLVTGVRSQEPVTAAQQSTAMPLGGQANDHSAPVAPARPASGP